MSDQAKRSKIMRIWGRERRGEEQKSMEGKESGSDCGERNREWSKAKIRTALIFQKEAEGGRREREERRLREKKATLGKETGSDGRHYSPEH